MNTSTNSVLFGELAPGAEFRSPRTERRRCTKLDQLYQDKWGWMQNLNTYVEGDALGQPTLAHFDNHEKVQLAPLPEDEFSGSGLGPGFGDEA